jgi:hypothetical protein
MLKNPGLAGERAASMLEQGMTACKLDPGRFGLPAFLRNSTHSSLRSLSGNPPFFSCGQKWS